MFKIYATEALDVGAPQNVVQNEIAKVEISFPWLGVRPIVIFVLCTLKVQSTRAKYNLYSDKMHPASKMLLKMLVSFCTFERTNPETKVHCFRVPGFVLLKKYKSTIKHKINPDKVHPNKGHRYVKTIHRNKKFKIYSFM